MMGFFIMLSVLFVCATVLALQWRHYEHSVRAQSILEKEEYLSALETRFKDYESLKSRVDALTIKAGFKL